MQGGSFEATTSGWALGGGARTVNGNESFFLGGASHQRSLNIPANGSAVSPWVCLSKNDPTLRFVARSSASGSGGNYTSLDVSVTLKGATGSVATVYLGQLQASAFGSWKPSSVFSYAAWLNQPWLYNGGTTVQAQFVVTVGGNGGSWNIDDLFVDPFKGI